MTDSHPIVCVYSIKIWGFVQIGPTTWVLKVVLMLKGTEQGALTQRAVLREAGE